MVRFRLIFLCALCIPGFGCDLVRDLIDDSEEPPQVGADPSLAPSITPTTEPPPAAPAPQTAPGFEIPGLSGLRIPLPIPDPNQPDPAPPARGSLPPIPAGSVDQHGFMTHAFLAEEAQGVHRALVDALPERERNQMRSVPFEIHLENQQPNAAAGCTGGNRSPVMLITTAMLELAAGISETKAYDELAQTNTYAQYVEQVIDQIRRRAPIQGVTPAMHSGPYAVDPHKLSRQRHLYAQQIAFIIGHELAHHYRGHTTCVGGRTDHEIQADELARMISRSAPPFGQPREVEADMWGATNVLEAGHTRIGDTWTHEGGLLNLDFFRRLGEQRQPNLLIAFLSTHPPSSVRIPIVRAVAQQWEPGRRPPLMPTARDLLGGAEGEGLPTPLGNIPIPIDPSQLPIPLPFPGRR